MHPWEMTDAEREAAIQRLKDENREALAAPLASEGSISPYQIGRMGKRARERWEKNCSRRLFIESLIRRLNDPEGERKIYERQEKAKAESIINARLSRIKDLKRLGIGKSGKMRPTYQRAIDDAEHSIVTTAAPYPDFVEKYTLPIITGG